jgi:hypothetical protein
MRWAIIYDSNQTEKKDLCQSKDYRKKVILMNNEETPEKPDIETR